MNLKPFYRNILPHIRKYILARPIMFITDKTHRQWLDKMYFKGNYISESEDFEKFRIQAWNDPDWEEILELCDPLEVHVRMGHFFETHLREIIFDLDTSDSVGLETAFDYAKGFYDWILTNREKEVDIVRILFSGNRGFHIRVLLTERLSPIALEAKMLEWKDAYNKPFIGVVDTNMCRPSHFIRMPFSYNKKGKKFSFFCERFGEFSETIAKEKSDQLKESFSTCV